MTLGIPFLWPPAAPQGAWPTTNPARFAGAHVRTNDPAGATLALLGLPDDSGVRLNNGRPGAADGPAAFRAALAAYGSSSPAGIHWPALFDAGDVQPARRLTDTHARATAIAQALIARNLTLLGIGGGHDLTLPLATAAAQRHGPLHVVYADAHLDVRDTQGSGMAMRALVEQGHARSLTVLGLDALANAREHRDWFDRHGRAINTTPDRFVWPDGPTYFSFDLDVIDQAHAPGVSAMNPAGWSPQLACAWCLAAGAHRNVVGFDLMELSPANDPTGRTARLAARLLLEFLAGYASR